MCFHCFRNQDILILPRLYWNWLSALSTSGGMYPCPSMLSPLVTEAEPTYELSEGSSVMSYLNHLWGICVAAFFSTLVLKLCKIPSSPHGFSLLQCMGQGEHNWSHNLSSLLSFSFHTFSVAGGAHMSNHSSHPNPCCLGTGWLHFWKVMVITYTYFLSFH